MSRGLCSLANLTIVGLNLEIDASFIIDEKEKRIKGKQEAAYVQLLGKERNCNLVKTNTYSRTNGSHQGALRLFAEKRADIFLNFQPYDFQTQVGENSFPIKAEKFIIAHPINTSKLAGTKLDIFQMISLEYLYFVFYFLTLLVCSALAVFVLALRSKENFRRPFRRQHLLKQFARLRNVLASFVFRNQTNRSILSIVLLLFLLQLLHSLTKSFVLNSFKTSSTLIDTGEIRDNAKKLAQSNRFICWLEEDTIRYTFPTLPKETFLYRLLAEKNRSDCMFYKSFNEHAVENLKKFHQNGFLFTDHTNAQFFVNFLLKWFKHTYWVPEENNSIFENILTFYVRKSLPRSMKEQIDNLGKLFLQFGIIQKMDSLIVFQAGQISEVRSSLYIIQSLNQIYEENIKQVSYDMHAFRSIFLFISTSQLSILFVFVIHCAVDKYRISIAVIIYRFLKWLRLLKSKAARLLLKLRTLYRNAR